MSARAGNCRSYVYVLQCRDGALYTGWTNDLAARMLAHARGRASKFTRSRLPVRLAAWSMFCDASSARSFEARFKRLDRGEKLQAVDRCEAFGIAVHKPPGITETSAGGEMATASTPAGEELRTLVERAKTARARIATPRGDIVFTFYPDDAPQHCAAFIKLAESGFYDGLKFHRVEPGFVVQGGDPSGDGTGGPGYKLEAEFNDRPHVRGTVAMARAGHPDSAGSQFYICLDDARFLDKQYTVFGQMTEGFETLAAIRRGDTMMKVSIE
jgi:cyclophilin family peptidyl-prolyl cis-trans isomerase/predicted GIY-YIG superfamily endonuclease